MRYFHCLASGIALACSLAPSAHARGAKLIDTFSSGGYSPYYGLAATQNALYGVTSSGNAKNDACGTVFQLVRGHGQWASTTLQSFSCGNGSGEPGPVAVDSATGDVWGSLFSGSYGEVFRLVKPKRGGTWSYETIYRFQGGTDGNLNAIASPLLLQGGAAFGIAAATDNGDGVEFYSLTNTGSGWQKTALATIAAGEGTSIAGFDAAGDAYISTYLTGGGGDVYQVAPQQGGTWGVTRIAQFKPAGDQYGVGTLVLNAAGTVFGLATDIVRSKVFALTPPAGGNPAWTKTIIATPSKRGYGLTSLALGLGNVLVGTIYGDQDAYGGAALALTPPANGSGPWTSTILWDFNRGPDTNPLSINAGPHGLYYGVLNNTYDNGAVYELKP